MRACREPRALLLLFACSLFLSACGEDEGETLGVAGDPCLAAIDCDELHACYRRSTAIEGEFGQCMALCDASLTRLCAGGEVCTNAGEVDLCYLGGSVALDQACSRGEECELGAICVTRTRASGEEVSACSVACEVGEASICTVEQDCVALEGTRGYCQESDDA